MVEQPSWSADQDDTAFPESSLLSRDLFTTHKSRRNEVIKQLEHLPQLYVDLNGQFSSRTQYDGHRSTVSVYLVDVK